MAIELDREEKDQGPVEDSDIVRDTNLPVTQRDSPEEGAASAEVLAEDPAEESDSAAVLGEVSGTSDLDLEASLILIIKGPGTRKK